MYEWGLKSLRLKRFPDLYRSDLCEFYCSGQKTRILRTRIYRISYTPYCFVPNGQISFKITTFISDFKNNGWRFRSDISEIYGTRRYLLVVIFDAVDFVLHIDGERNSVQTFVTHVTSKTAGVKRFTHGLQNL